VSRRSHRRRHLSRHVDFGDLLACVRSAHGPLAGNPATLLSGIATGIIGYAVGTYLGIGLALLLARFA
jgi:hypothetical protein